MASVLSHPRVSIVIQQTAFTIHDFRPRTMVSMSMRIRGGMRFVDSTKSRLFFFPREFSSRVRATKWSKTKVVWEHEVSPWISQTHFLSPVFGSSGSVLPDAPAHGPCPARSRRRDAETQNPIHTASEDGDNKAAVQKGRTKKGGSE